MTNRRSLSEQLEALLAYRSRPEEDAPVEPMQSNWTTVPANDNASTEEVAKLSVERELHVTPSVDEIMRQVESGPVVRNEAGQIVTIGKLRFSDGTQHEQAYTVGPDGDVVRYSRRMPAGAMLGTREKSERALGGKGYTPSELEASGDFFALSLGTAAPRYIKRTSRRNGRSLTPEQSRSLIDDAIRNTQVMPAIRKLPPGLPCGHPRVADSFLGMQTAAAGQSGSIAWQDIGQVIENRKIWRKVKAALREKDIVALDAAMKAQTLAEVGEAVGQSQKYAKHNGGGRRALIAANDNLAAAIKKYTA